MAGGCGEEQVMAASSHSASHAADLGIAWELLVAFKGDPGQMGRGDSALRTPVANLHPQLT